MLCLVSLVGGASYPDSAHSSEGWVSEDGLICPLDPTGEYEGQLGRGAEDGPEVATPPVTFSLCFSCWRRGSIGILAPLQHAHQTGDQKDQAAFAVPSVAEQLGHGDWYRRGGRG